MRNSIEMTVKLAPWKVANLKEQAIKTRKAKELSIHELSKLIWEKVGS